MVVSFETDFSVLSKPCEQKAGRSTIDVGPLQGGSTLMTVIHSVGRPERNGQPLQDDEALLIESVRKGDAQALTELFELNRERLQRMIQLRMDRRVRARVDVADVLQDAYLDLASQLANYARNPELPFFVWLRRITSQRLAKIHRTHLGQAKRDAAREIPLERIADIGTVCLTRDLVGRSTSAAGLAMQKELQEKVEEGITRMSDSEREIIFVRHVRQLSNVEAASLLKLSVQAASKRYSRALRRLRSVLKKNAPGLLD
jgi:RNA polymerase sigma-70 factor (ECF subfamily)